MEDTDESKWKRQNKQETSQSASKYFKPFRVSYYNWKGAEQHINETLLYITKHQSNSLMFKKEHTQRINEDK